MAFPIRRRNDVSTYAGHLPLAQEAAQIAPPPEVAPQVAAPLPPLMNDRDAARGRRQGFLAARTGAAGQVAGARILANAANTNPLMGDLATGGYITNRSNVIAEQGNRNIVAGGLAARTNSEARLNDTNGEIAIGMLPINQEVGRSEAGLNNARSWGIGQEAGQGWAQIGQKQKVQDALLPHDAAKAAAEANAAPYQLGANVNLTNADAASTLARTDDVAKQNTYLGQQNNALLRMKAPELGTMQTGGAAQTGQAGGAAQTTQAAPQLQNVPFNGQMYQYNPATGSYTDMGGNPVSNLGGQGAAAPAAKPAANLPPASTAGQTPSQSAAPSLPALPGNFDEGRSYSQDGQGGFFPTPAGGTIQTPGTHKYANGELVNSKTGKAEFRKNAFQSLPEGDANLQIVGTISAAGLTPQQRGSLKRVGNKVVAFDAGTNGYMQVLN
jgi:hypothetical protein